MPILPPPRHLILVFIHGFSGTEASFGEFPDVLRKAVKDRISIPSHILVTCRTYHYQTQGNFGNAVTNFAEWLKDQTREIEGVGGGEPGCARVVICGHSMGGLVMVDALDHIKYSQWPRIVACIAFDTPYLGLSGALYNETEAVVSKVMPLVIRLLSGPKLPFAVPTSLAFISGSTLLATQPEVAAMGLCAVGVLSAYILLSYGPSASASVGVLWKNLEFILVLMQSDLNARLKKVVDRHEAGLVRFNAFYVKCPRAKDEYFVQLPEPDHIAFAYFVAVHNSKQRNAIKGHMTMFNENTNDSFCPLVRDTATLIEGCFE